MICEPHLKDIEYLCRCPACNYLPLCKECCNDHAMKYNNTHNVDFIPIRKALLLAEENLKKNKEQLLKIMEPHQHKKQILQKIEAQRKELLKEKQIIIEKVSRQIDEEIHRLVNENKNNGFNANQQEMMTSLQKKIDEIEQNLNHFKRKPSNLRKSLVLEIDSYLTNLARNNKNLTSMKLHASHNFKTYDFIKHDFILSKLELKQRLLHGKPLKKIMNQSPLYYLIDESTSTMPILYFVSQTNSSLKVYDVDKQIWHDYFYANIPKDCATVYDRFSQKFYFIGGSNQNSSKSILSFSETQNRWQNFPQALQEPRANPMAVLIQSSKILIVGGFGQEKKIGGFEGGFRNSGNNRHRSDALKEVLKSCQLYEGFNPKRTKQFGNTNFATVFGTLVTFNTKIQKKLKTFVFKIGGKSSSNRQSNITEIIQRFDYSKVVEEKLPNPVWTYIEIQDIKKGLEHENVYKLFYLNQGAVQINPNEIFIFGGNNSNNEGVNQSYILEVQSFKIVNKTTSQTVDSFRYFARWINEKPLISPDNFNNLQPIVWKKKVYSLQNISDPNRSNQVLDRQKRLVEFNMYEWLETENIVLQ